MFTLLVPLHTHSQYKNLQLLFNCFVPRIRNGVACWIPAWPEKEAFGKCWWHWVRYRIAAPCAKLGAFVWKNGNAQPAATSQRGPPSQLPQLAEVHRTHPAGTQAA